MLLMKLSWKPQLAPFRKYKKEIFAKQAAVADFIHQIGEYPALREKATSVPIDKISSDEYKAKFAYMKKCLLKYRKLTGMGRGIAAPQLGIPEAFACMYMPEIPEELLIIINPHITKQAKEKLRYPEMCMSAASAVAPVVRPSWIEFEYYGEDGEKHVWNTKATEKLGRLYNRVFEHEIDHLFGIINIDRVQSKEIIYESDPTFYATAAFEKVG